MPGKRKSAAPVAEPALRPEDLYPSLREGPTPAERRAALEADMERRGIKALTAEEFDKALEGRSDWPEGEDFEDFLAWRRQERQERAGDKS